MSNKKQISLNLVTNYTSSLVGVVLGLLVPPLALSYWNADRYGIWTLVTSLVAYLSTSGLGIETAAAILMAKAESTIGKNKIFVAALLLLTASSAFFCLILVGVVSFTPDWLAVFGRIPSNLVEDSRTAVLVFVAFFFINYPFSIVSSGFIGYQRQYIDNIFRLLVPLSGLVSLLVVMSLQGNLTTYAFIQGCITLALSILKLCVYWIFVRNKGHFVEISTEISADRPFATATSVLKSGLRYFLYGLSVLIIMNADNFLISNYVNLASVTSYTLTAKIFLMANTLVTLLLASLAPVISREFGRKNYPWLVAGYRDLTKIAVFLGGSVCVGGVLFLNDFIVHLWVGEAGSAGFPVIVALAFYCFFSIVTNVSNIFLIQGNLTRGLISLGWSEAALHLILVLVFIPSLGVLGVVLGQVLATCFTQAWRSPRLLGRNTGGKLTFDWSLFRNFSIILLIPTVLAGCAVSILVKEVPFRIVCSLLLLVVFLLGCYKFFLGALVFRELPSLFRARFKQL